VVVVAVVASVAVVVAVVVRVVMASVAVVVVEVPNKRGASVEHVRENVHFAHLGCEEGRGQHPLHRLPCPAREEVG